MAFSYIAAELVMTAACLAMLLTWAASRRLLLGKSAVRRFVAFYAVMLTALLLAGPVLGPPSLPKASAAGSAQGLEVALRQIATPIEDAPFPTVVRALTGHRLLPFDVEGDAERLARIRRALARAVRLAIAEGLRARRPNEAGNAIEQYVERGLREEGFEADAPRTQSGRRQAAGYPDLEVRDRDGALLYLEVKTYSRRTANTTQRSFYFSPSANPKVLADAAHLLVGFELTQEREGNVSLFRPVAWQLVDLSSLRVTLKYEFNASNRRIYREGRVVASERTPL